MITIGTLSNLVRQQQSSRPFRKRSLRSQAVFAIRTIFFLLKAHKVKEKISCVWEKFLMVNFDP